MANEKPITSETQFFYSRSLVPWRDKLNPIWLFSNDGEPTPPDWYYVEQPNYTMIKWYLRNPFQNAGKYAFGYAMLYPALIIGALIFFFDISYYWLFLLLLCVGGVEDRNYKAFGMAPLGANVWSDDGQVKTWFRAFKLSVIWLGGFFPLPYVSLENRFVIFYWGWQACGFFGLKINLRFGPKVV